MTVLAGSSGSGKTRILFSKMAEALTSSRQPLLVIGVSDEHSKETMRGKVLEALNGREYRNTNYFYSIRTEKDIEDLITTLESCVRHFNAMELYLDLHLTELKQGVLSHLATFNANYPKVTLKIIATQQTPYGGKPKAVNIIMGDLQLKEAVESEIVFVEHK